MNKERLELLADHLEKLPREKFDMQEWCGTACCIAGHAVALAHIAVVHPESSQTAYAAQEWLGLDDKVGLELFVPTEAPLSEITKNQAASVIRHLIKTGKVEWEAFV